MSFLGSGDGPWCINKETVAVDALAGGKEVLTCKLAVSWLDRPMVEALDNEFIYNYNLRVNVRNED